MHLLAFDLKNKIFSFQFHVRIDPTNVVSTKDLELFDQDVLRSAFYVLSHLHY